MQSLIKLRNMMKLLSIKTTLLFNSDEIMGFLGVHVEKSCAIITPEEITIICPEGSILSLDGIQVIEYSVYGYHKPENIDTNIKKHLDKIVDFSHKTGVNKNSCPLWVADKFYFSSLVDLTEDIGKILMQKDKAFIHKLTETMSLNKVAFDSVKDYLKIGMSDIDLYNIVSNSYSKHAKAPVHFMGDFVTGTRTAEIGGPPIGCQINKGDAIIVDIQPKLNGYCCDTTRTFFAGKPNEEQHNAYMAVIKALKCGEGMLRTGVIAEDIFIAVSQCIQDSGYSKLPHHAGHGVGYSWYEKPYFIKNCKEQLLAGMIVTIEPGIYTETFGIRIENNYLITETECINLFEYPTEIEHFIIQ